MTTCHECNKEAGWGKKPCNTCGNYFCKSCQPKITEECKDCDERMCRDCFNKHDCDEEEKTSENCWGSPSDSENDSEDFPIRELDNMTDRELLKLAVILFTDKHYNTIADTWKELIKTAREGE